MAELEPMEVIMKIDFAASNGLEVVAHAEQVSELVRCKDCINWNGNDCITIFGLYAPRPDDYCSRGEKNSG